jgi:hypothetical protein
LRADAILDRVVHNAYRIAMKGDSMRKKQAPPVVSKVEPLTEQERWITMQSSSATVALTPVRLSQNGRSLSMEIAVRIKRNTQRL